MICGWETDWVRGDTGEAEIILFVARRTYLMVSAPGTLGVLSGWLDCTEHSFATLFSILVAISTTAAEILWC